MTTTRAAAAKVKDTVAVLIKTIDDTGSVRIDDDLLFIRAMLLNAGRRSDEVVTRERNKPFVQTEVIEPSTGMPVRQEVKNYG